MVRILPAGRPIQGRGTSALLDQVSGGGRIQAYLDTSLRQIQGVPGIADRVGPGQLTARARRLLEQGRELLGQLRDLAARLPLDDDRDPLAENHRLTVAMADSLFRTVQAFPDAATAQLRLCEGLEGVLSLVTERTVALEAAVVRRQGEADRVDRLTDALAGLHSRGNGRPPTVYPDRGDAAGGKRHRPVRFLAEPPEDQPALRFIACHSLTVAQVVARVVHHDPDLEPGH